MRKQLPRSRIRERGFRTSEVARVLRVHPNTIRQWEARGMVTGIGRTASGYRVFSRTHLDQLKVVRGALGFTFAGGEISRTARAVLENARGLRFREALGAARELAEVIEDEHRRAKHAVELVRSWTVRTEPAAPHVSLRRKEAAAALRVTRETLRTWERNGLLVVPRDPDNGYRCYGPEELDRLEVIRALRSAGCSMMSIRRMFVHLDAGGSPAGIERALDTPVDPEDMYCATNFWLTTLDTLLAKSAKFRNLLTALHARHSAAREPAQAAASRAARVRGGSAD